MKPKTPAGRVDSLSSIPSQPSEEVSQELKNLKNDKLFRLKNDVAAKYKFKFHAEQKRKKILAQRILTNEEIIMMNKDKVLVCVDENQSDVNKLRYCFVTRHVVKLS